MCPILLVFSRKKTKTQKHINVQNAHVPTQAVKSPPPCAGQAQCHGARYPNLSEFDAGQAHPNGTGCMEQTKYILALHSHFTRISLALHSHFTLLDGFLSS